MTAKTTRLDISIGPVQGFVSQSRRTRDLWGSSYLLAFLAAHAMRGAHEAGGKIVQPMVKDDPLYRWVSGDVSGDPPTIGTVPNHFVVKLSGVARPVADSAEAAFHAAWRRVCDAVWAHFVEHACPAGDATEAIWQRQVRAFWEVSWTFGPWGNQSSLLARRKHWRGQRSPDEPGDKCTVMHDLQELSGHVRARNGRQQDEFWRRVKRRLGDLDLQKNERLCAVAFVKRMFPKVAGDALGGPVAATHWPSTVYVAAVPWIRSVLVSAADQAREYAAAVRGSADNDVFPMQRPPFAGLDVAEAGDFPKLDANYLHREFITNEQLCSLKDETSTDGRARLGVLLKDIYAVRTGSGRRLGPPPVFYALLLADGDRLGKLVSELGGPEVSNALASFTAKVPGIVKRHSGVTVYAGGDDVLAMLPVADALSCAGDLAKAYRGSFPNQATISAAVVFAHVRLPLRSVLDEAHRLLDTVAKDGNGRNSLAAVVLKPGGRHCQWVTSWTRPTAGGSCAVTLIDDLVREISRNASEPGLSGALLYRLRETLTALCGWDRWRPGAWGEVPAGVDIRPFLHAEISHSLDVRADRGAEIGADEMTDRICRVLPGSHATEDHSSRVGIDGLLLARFLADPAQRESER